MNGRILFNAETGRLVLNGNDLHCGDIVTVLIGGEWAEDRLETDVNDRWYLVNHPDVAPYGLTAKW